MDDENIILESKISYEAIQVALFYSIIKKKGELDVIKSFTSINNGIFAGQLYNLAVSYFKESDSEKHDALNYFSESILNEVIMSGYLVKQENQIILPDQTNKSCYDVVPLNMLLNFNGIEGVFNDGNDFFPKDNFVSDKEGKQILFSEIHQEKHLNNILYGIVGQNNR
jgi:hypothetical protein